MRLLLPPSETKRSGGAPHSGRFALSFASQDRVRFELSDALEAFSRDSPAEAAKVLGLGPKSISELAHNAFGSAPVMPAIDRYTGVLYSATGADSWSPEQRAWAGEHVFIHSALWGIVSSLDEIPAYRLSHNSRLGGRSLGAWWGSDASDAIAEMAGDDWVLDARSAAYRELAPIPVGVRSSVLEVVSADGGKALNHFNKVHKGELVSALVRDAPKIASPKSLVDWGQRFSRDLRADDELLELVVSS